MGQAVILEVNEVAAEMIVLLRQDLGALLSSYQGLIRLLRNYPFWAVQLKKECCDIDPQGRLDVIFKSLGWKGLLRRMTRVFYPKISSDEFWPVVERFAPFGIEGINRHLLLFLFAQQGANSNLALFTFLQQRSTLDYCKVFTQRSERLDYLLLMLFLLEQECGAEKVHLMLQHGEYHTLYNLLPFAAKQHYIESLLNYACSIRDRIFFEDVV